MLTVSPGKEARIRIETGSYILYTVRLNDDGKPEIICHSPGLIGLQDFRDIVECSQLIIQALARYPHR